MILSVPYLKQNSKKCNNHMLILLSPTNNGGGYYFGVVNSNFCRALSGA